MKWFWADINCKVHTIRKAYKKFEVYTKGTHDVRYKILKCKKWNCRLECLSWLSHNKACCCVDCIHEVLLYKFSITRDVRVKLIGLAAWGSHSFSCGLSHGGNLKIWSDDNTVSKKYFIIFENSRMLMLNWL